MPAETPEEAMQSAAWHLRMELAGKSGYSGTPGKIDKGWAELLIERLETYGYKLVPVERKPQDIGRVVDELNASFTVR